MEAIDEKLLSLRLSLGCDQSKIKKRKREECEDEEEGYESKIFNLLQTREQMLKLDQRPKPMGGLNLIHLLLVSATAVDGATPIFAAETLSELYRHTSVSGDAVQRVAAYFADALTARLLTTRSPFYDVIMKPPTRHEHLLAFTHLHRVTPFYQFAHFTANQAILEVFENESLTNHNTLHIIDFDISHGFQWPSLIQSLAAKNRKVSLKITGLGRSPCELRETEARLTNFASAFRNLSFVFTGLLSDSEDELLARTQKTRSRHVEVQSWASAKTGPDVTLAMNLVLHLNKLTQYSETLKTIRLLRPSVVTVVEQEGYSRIPRNFLSRFVESLHYFAALFDSLDDCLPLDSQERLVIERDYLGNEIKSTMMSSCCDDNDNRDVYNNDLLVPRFERMETWKARMESHGFRGSKLSCKNVMQAKLLLKITSHSSCSSSLEFDRGYGGGGFRVFERDDGKALSLAWQDRPLTTASVWHCV